MTQCPSMSPTILFVVSLLLIYSIIRLLKYTLNHYRLYQELRHMPGPPINNPFIGHLGLFVRIIISNSLGQYGIKLNQLMNELVDRYDRDNVGLVRLWFGPFMPCIIVHDAQIVNTILNHPDYMAKSRFYQPFTLVAGQQLLNLSGKKFIDEKKKFIRFFKVDSLDGYISQIECHVRRLNDIVEQCLSTNDGHFEDGTKLASALVFDCVGESFLATQFNSQTNGLPLIKRLFNNVLVLLNLFILTPWNYFLPTFSPIQLFIYFPTYISALFHVVYVRTFLYFLKQNRQKKVLEIIVQNTKEGSSNLVSRPVAMLDWMIEAKMFDQPNRVENINSNIGAFLVAANQTTSTALAWTIYLLCHHTEEQAKCRDEVERYLEDLKNSGQTVTYSNLKQLKYLECCIKESLRMYAPAPFLGRRGRVPLAVTSQFTLPPNVNLFLFMQRLHHREDYFKQAKQFTPERFESSQCNQFCNNYSAYIPFCIGHTACIGKEYAMLLMKLFFVRLLPKYTITAMDQFGDAKPIYTFLDQAGPFPLKFKAISNEKS